MQAHSVLTQHEVLASGALHRRSIYHHRRGCARRRRMQIIVEETTRLLSRTRASISRQPVSDKSTSKDEVHNSST